MTAPSDPIPRAATALVVVVLALAPHAGARAARTSPARSGRWSGAGVPGVGDDGAVTTSVPRILRLSRELRGGGARFAVLHVVSGGRHHIGWFELSGDPWRVGLTEAGAVVDAGVPLDEVRAETEEVLGRLRVADDADDAELPEPVGPVEDPARLAADRRRAIRRLEEELDRA